MIKNSPPNWPEKECFTPAQLSRRSNIELDFLAELIENKVIVADGPRENLYSISQLIRLQRLCRLIKDIEFEASTVALAMILLKRIESLEKRLAWLQLATLDASNSTMH